MKPLLVSGSVILRSAGRWRYLLVGPRLWKQHLFYPALSLRSPAPKMNSMKRCFVLFLMLLMPLQMAWAAIDVLACHGSDGAGVITAVADEQTPDQQKKKGDADCGDLQCSCGSCHLSNASLLFDVSASASIATGVILAAARPRSYSSRSPAEPERPNWLALA